MAKRLGWTYAIGEGGAQWKRTLAPVHPPPPHSLPPRGNEKVEGLTGNNPRLPPRGPTKKKENGTHGASAGQAPKNPKSCKKQGTRIFLDRLVRNKSPRPVPPQCNVEQKETCFLPGAFFSHHHEVALYSTLHCGERGSGFYFAHTGSAGHVLASMPRFPKGGAGRRALHKNHPRGLPQEPKKNRRSTPQHAMS